MKVVSGVAPARGLTRDRRAALARTRLDGLRQLIATLTECRTLAEIYSAIEKSFTAMFGFPFSIFLMERGHLQVGYRSFQFEPDRGDLEIAAAAIASHRRVYSERPERHARLCALPLTTCKGTIGAIGFTVDRGCERIRQHKWALLECFTNLTALAVLRATLETEALNADALHDTDRFQKALMHSISHNVRTPLSSIIGVLSTLQENHAGAGEQPHRELIDTARLEAERLNRLLGNLLDLSRIEAGVLSVRADPCEVQDLIGAALEQLGAAVRDRNIELILPPDLPFVHMDFVLIVQVLVNLLDNAIKYSQAGTPVRLEARVLAGHLEICVSDHGRGISEEDLERVFEKFNRAQLSGETGGVGLGLSICKGLIEAHHGNIWAERRDPNGTNFRFTLPLAVQKSGG